MINNHYLNEVITPRSPVLRSALLDRTLYYAIYNNKACVSMCSVADKLPRPNA